MQRMAIEAVLPGMKLRHDVLNADGKLLLAGGQILTPAYIARLVEVGVPAVYIDSPYASDIEAPEVIRDETRVKAIRAMKEAMNRLRRHGSVDVEFGPKIVGVILNEILSHPQALFHLTDIRTHDDYTFGHSVNVCVLSLMLGRRLGYNERQLKELGLGALLHDVGKMMIPLEVLNKPGKLSAQEWQVMQTHSDYGFAILRKQQDKIPLLAAHVAFQHHEKMNGQGYPRGLAGQEIQEHARITAIADTYDALTSARPYRKALLPHEAYEILMAENDSHFDSLCLQAFLTHIAVYPVGTMVRLTTGDIGIVESVIPGLQTRPLVRIVRDHYGRVLKERQQIDLARSLTVFIQSVLTDHEVARLYQQ